VLDELMDGDIIVFQKEENNDEGTPYELPTCKDYFKCVVMRIQKGEMGVVSDVVEDSRCVVSLQRSVQSS